MWARYSSAQFDQGSGRHACNNPYNQTLEAELYQKMESTSTWYIEHKDFLDMIAPSFCGVEDSEEMAAILARTHVIVLTDNGVYYRLASTEKSRVQCIPWPRTEMKDILAMEYKPIFKAYKADPENHTLPEGYHADSVWSQELLRKLLQGEPIPQTITVRHRGLFGEEVGEIQRAPRLLPAAEAAVKVKQEKADQVFKQLKRQPLRQVIELDSPSPAKRPRAESSTVPVNPSLPGLCALEETDDFPGVGEADELQVALECEMDDFAASES